MNNFDPSKIYLDQGLLSQIGDICLAVHKPCRVLVVGEPMIIDLYGSTLLSALSDNGFTPIPCPLPWKGESVKTFAGLSFVLEALANQNFTRADMLIALGGGSTGDLTGLAASLFMRGIDFVQVPTTLLAAVDASVGGKNAINLPQSKNTIGTFWHPKATVIDVNTLASLPIAAQRDGFAEIIKCGFIGSSNLLDDIKNFSSLAFNKDTYYQRLIPLIRSALEVKTDLVRQDEKDLGPRQLLNFGHSIGHALEYCSNYQISHGQGVAIGMTFVARASYKMSWVKEDFSNDLCSLLTSLGFSLDFKFSAQEIFNAMVLDKKRAGDTLTLVIPKNIGHCVLKTIPLNSLMEFIRGGLS